MQGDGPDVVACRPIRVGEIVLCGQRVGVVWAQETLLVGEGSLSEDVPIEDRIVHGLCQVMGVSPVARFARFEIIARRIMLSEWVGLVS